MSTNRPSKATAIICTKRSLQELFCIYRPENHYGPWDWDLAFAECHRHRVSTSSSIYPQPVSAYESASPSYTLSLPSVFSFLACFFIVRKLFEFRLFFFIRHFCLFRICLLHVILFSSSPSLLLSPGSSLPPSSYLAIPTPCRHVHDNHGTMTKQTEQAKSYPIN